MGIVLGEHFDCGGEFFVELGDKAIVLDSGYFGVAQYKFRRKDNLIGVEGESFDEGFFLLEPA